MTKPQEERLVKAFEGIALGLNAIAKTMEDRLNREHPPEKELQDAEVYRQGEEHQEAAPTPGRFEAAFLEAAGKKR